MSRLKWDTHAGGVCARDDKYGYVAQTPMGSYHVDPISHRFNVNRHLGYRAAFCNKKGLIEGGLWQGLSGPIWAPRLVNLRDARRICREHFEQLQKKGLTNDHNP